MPFKSEKQRRYLFKFHPEIAKRWTKETVMRKLKKSNDRTTVDSSRQHSDSGE